MSASIEYRRPSTSKFRPQQMAPWSVRFTSTRCTGTTMFFAIINSYQRSCPSKTTACRVVSETKLSCQRFSICRAWLSEMLVRTVRSTHLQLPMSSTATATATSTRPLVFRVSTTRVCNCTRLNSCSTIFVSFSKPTSSARAAAAQLGHIPCVTLTPAARRDLVHTSAPGHHAHSDIISIFFVSIFISFSECAVSLHQIAAAVDLDQDLGDADLVRVVAEDAHRRQQRLEVGRV